MVKALIETVSDRGYHSTTVTTIVTTARASRRTFYEHFAGRDDCFLAAIDHAVVTMGDLAADAYEGPGSWSERVRAALEAILRFLQDEPAMASVVFVESLHAGPKVLARRAQVIKTLAKAIDDGRPQGTRKMPALTAETVVGGAITIVQTRLAERPNTRLMALVSPLTATIVLPYLGPAAASRELARPMPSAQRPPRPVAPPPQEPEPHDSLRMRLTHRTLQVLAAINQEPGACNRQIAEAAGVLDQGQISRLLARLQSLELIENVGQRPQTGPHEWHLTERGAALRSEVAAKANGGPG